MHLYHIRGSDAITFERMLQLQLSDYLPNPFITVPIAIFSSAFSADGSKFTVASENGVLAVWDIRSTAKPLKVLYPNTIKALIANGVLRTRLPGDLRGEGFRAVKFAGAGEKEVLAVTEVRRFLSFYCKTR